MGSLSTSHPIPLPAHITQITWKLPKAFRSRRSDGKSDHRKCLPDNDLRQSPRDAGNRPQMNPALPVVAARAALVVALLATGIAVAQDKPAESSPAAVQLYR